MKWNEINLQAWLQKFKSGGRPNAADQSFNDFNEASAISWTVQLKFSLQLHT